MLLWSRDRPERPPRADSPRGDQASSLVVQAETGLAVPGAESGPVTMSPRNPAWLIISRWIDLPPGE